MRTWRLSCLALASMGALACSSEPISDQEASGEVADSIINGSPDTTHQAVVAWLHGSKCSATIVHVAGSNGYALTAAHCVGGPNGTIRQGNNHNNPDRTYNVVEQEVHPEYGASSAYDFGMVRFTGADGATPVIALETPAQDNIGPGTQLDLIGYGNTENGPTATRRHRVMPVDWETDLLLAFDQTTGGMCSGDSGGATLHQGRVAGVNSFVTETDCTGFGVAVRVSAVKNTFIDPFINGTPYLPQTCDQCTDAHSNFGLCGDAASNCQGSNHCQNYLDCWGNCSTNSCVIQCGLDYAVGKNIYDQFESCLCNTACASECNGVSWCEPDPACWLVANDPSCQGCLEGSCCGEATACAANAQCTSCLDSSLNPACDTNAQLIALDDCLLANCGAECDITGPGGSGGGGGTGAGGSGGGSVGGGSVGGGSVGGGNVGGSGAGTTSSGSSSGNDDEAMVVEQGGCGGCRVGERRANDAWGWLLLGLGVLGLRRRRG